MKRFKKWLWRLFISNLPEETDLDVLRKHLLLNLIGFMGVLFLGFFSGYALLQGDYSIAVADSVLLVFILILLLLLRTGTDHDLLSLLGTVVAGLFFTFLIIHDGVVRHTYYWAFVYPLVAVYLVGRKKGLLLSLLLLLAACGYLLLLPLLLERPDQYGVSMTTRFIATYITILVFAVVAEFVQQVNQKKLKESGGRLQAALNRITSDSQRLAGANARLQQEIEERQRAERSLRSSEAFLEDIIESIQDGISVLDTDLTIRHTNSVMQKWYGDGRQLVGDKCYHCYRGRDQPCAPCPTIRCMQTGMTEREEVPGLPGSAAQWLELFSFPLRDRESGEITGAVEFVRDITEARKLELQLSHAQKMQAVGTLAGGIAHDFNNLMMGIQGRVSLIKTSLPEPSRNREHLEAIEEQIDSARHLTSQLLATARGGKYDPRPTDLNQVVRVTAAMFGRTRKELSIQLRLDPQPVVAEIDRKQFEQVLLNLYINAWQAMPGGGELSLETTTVSLDQVRQEHFLIPAGRYARIVVADTGAGIPESIRQQIFDPFFTTREKERGTGLGLSSAYGIVKNHQGFIMVESTGGQGSRFTILLPWSAGRPAESEERRQQGVVHGSGTVLLVDDEQMILEVGAAMLRELGYTVATAGSGRQALEMVEEQPGRFDLVILDQIMPGLDGLAVFKRLQVVVPKLPVVLASGYALDDQATEIMRGGCRGFLQKPFNLEELSRMVRRALESSQENSRESG